MYGLRAHGNMTFLGLRGQFSCLGEYLLILSFNVHFS
jgi:hypothetical protein